MLHKYRRKPWHSGAGWPSNPVESYDVEVEMSAKAESSEPKKEIPTGIRLKQKLVERSAIHIAKK